MMELFFIVSTIKENDYFWMFKNIFLQSQTQLILNILAIFTDGSLNTKSNVGWGAYFFVPENKISGNDFIPEIKLKRFTETSSSKLEIQTLLWALEETKTLAEKILVHTDSQTIVGLPKRRERLEKNGYFSKKGRRINNDDLYRRFFQLTDEVDCEFRKVEGHKKTSKKNNIDRLFTFVDQASRNAVRGEMGLSKNSLKLPIFNVEN